MHVVDLLGLGDPLLARALPVTDPGRSVISAATEGGISRRCESGENRLRDPQGSLPITRRWRPSHAAT